MRSLVTAKLPGIKGKPGSRSARRTTRRRRSPISVPSRNSAAKYAQVCGETQRRLPPPTNASRHLSRRRLLADRLEQHALAPAPVELGVEDLLPGAEVEAAVRDRQHDLMRHQLALEMGIGVVLAGVMKTGSDGLVRGATIEQVVDV